MITQLLPNIPVVSIGEPNSIAIWDNRSTQHKPINDYFPAHRLLERVAIDGDKPF